MKIAALISANYKKIVLLFILSITSTVSCTIPVQQSSFVLIQFAEPSIRSTHWWHAGHRTLSQGLPGKDFVHSLAHPLVQHLFCSEQSKSVWHKSTQAELRIDVKSTPGQDPGLTPYP